MFLDFSLFQVPVRIEGQNRYPASRLQTQALKASCYSRKCERFPSVRRGSTIQLREARNWEHSFSRPGPPPKANPSWRELYKPKKRKSTFNILRSESRVILAQGRRAGTFSRNSTRIELPTNPLPLSQNGYGNWCSTVLYFLLHPTLLFNGRAHSEANMNRARHNRRTSWTRTCKIRASDGGKHQR